MSSDVPAATERLARAHELVVAYLGSDVDGRRAIALAARALRDEAFVLAYGDLFLAIGASLLVVLVVQATLRPISLAELRPRRDFRRHLLQFDAELLARGVADDGAHLLLQPDQTQKDDPFRTLSGFARPAPGEQRGRPEKPQV